jgi:hypothetical protein
MITKTSLPSLVIGVTAGFLVGLLAFMLPTGHVVRAQESSNTASAIVRAEEFQLVDKAGHPRALLAFSVEGQPYLTMLDHKGGEIVWLGLSDESGLVVHDIDGKTRLILSLDRSGEPSLVVRDRQHRMRSFGPE